MQAATGAFERARATEPSYASLVAASFVDWRTAARRPIANLVDFARHALSRPEAGPQADPLRPGVLRRLDHHVVEPVRRAGVLEGKSRLVIVPHAELHFLPFAALLAAGPERRFLVERFELSYAPSASVWVRLEDRASRRSTNVLAMAPYPVRLPAFRREVDGIRDILGRRSARVLIGPAATERALRNAAPRHGILHLATFGVLNKHNPLFSFVELAPDGAGDGRLEVHAIFDLELDGQLVVLSACQTAVGSGAGAVGAGNARDHAPRRRSPFAVPAACRAFAHVCQALSANGLARLERYREDAARKARFSTWLVTVGHHQVVDWLRLRGGRRRVRAPAGLSPLQQRIFTSVFVEFRCHSETYEIVRSSEDGDLSFAGFLSELAETYRVVERSRPREVMRYLSAPAPIGSEKAVIEEHLTTAELAGRLSSIVAQLPADQRAALRLFVVERMPAADVAHVVGWPNAKAVYNRVYRTLDTLRATLEGEGIGPEDL